MRNLKSVLLIFAALAGLALFLWLAGPVVWEFFDSGNFLDGEKVLPTVLVVGISTVGAVLIAWLKKRR